MATMADPGMVPTDDPPEGGQHGSEALNAAWVREVCLAAGADDAGFVALDTPGLEGERDHVREALPGTRSLIAVCVRLARDNFRSRATSNVNTEMDTAIP